MPVETKTKLIPINAIHSNSWNPNVVPDEVMDSLVENIRRNGILQSVTVREVAEPDGETVPGTGVYELIDGEHRWRAATLAEHTKVWGTISEMSRSDARAQTLALNKLRGEMDPTGVAQIFADLKRSGASLDELSKFTGYGVDEMEASIKLLDYTWPDPPPPDDDTDEEWKTLSIRMPAEVYDIVTSELERLRTVAGEEPDFRALELMAVTSAQTPLESLM